MCQVVSQLGCPQRVDSSDSFARREMGMHGAASVALEALLGSASPNRCSRRRTVHNTLSYGFSFATGWQMSEERVERRLAAILAADVVGYSRLMGENEESTLAALKAIRRELTDPKIDEHRGRIVKTTGDGLLAEFASVVDAVRCAVEIQREMPARNASVPQTRRIEFRVGINL